MLIHTRTDSRKSQIHTQEFQDFQDYWETGNSLPFPMEVVMEELLQTDPQN